MGKPTICIGVTAKLISAFVFATRIVQFLFYLTPKFQASSHLLYQAHGLQKASWFLKWSVGFTNTDFNQVNDCNEVDK